MTPARPTVALVPYPISNGFRARLEGALGEEPEYVNLAELRRRPARDVARKLWSLRGCHCILPFETEDMRAIAPVLEAVAVTARPSRLELVTPELRRTAVRRIDTVRALGSLSAASAAGVAARRAARRELGELVDAPRLQPAPARTNAILYLNANLWLGLKAGGSIAHVAGVVNALLEAGFDVDYATLVDPIGIAPQARVHKLDPPSTFSLPVEATYYRSDRDTARRASAIAGTSGAGLVYQRMSVASYAGVAVSRRLQLPLVLEYNGSEVWVAENWGRRLRYHEEALLAEEVSLRHAHLIVTISDPLRDELLARGVEPGRVVMHPNGVDLDLFHPELLEAPARAVRARLGIPENALVVAFVGTFGQWHGAEVLARAIALLGETDRAWLDTAGVRFLLVGDGLRMPKVREIVDASPARDLVHFAGLVPQPDAPAYLMATDVLASPHVPNADGSRFFGSPTKLFEYMAAGKAIVASRLDQIGDVLAPGLDARALPTGLPAADEPALAVLTTPGDERELMRGLRFALEQPAWRRRLGANARERVAGRYTWRHHVAAIVAALDARGLRS